MLVIVAMLAAAQAGAGTLPTWMVGSWCTPPHPIEKTCERWEIGTDGVMRGTSETWRGGLSRSREKMEIRRDGAGYVLNGHKGVVYAAPWASHLLVTARTGGGQRDRDGVSLFLIDANLPGIVRRDYPTVDGSRASEVYFENVAIPGDALLGGEGAGLPLIEQIVDEATIAVCAEATGVMQKLHEGTLEYTQQRKQFGVPIAKFQVLQHRMVDMFMEVEQARSMTIMGTLKLDLPPAERMAAVSATKSKVARGAKFVGQNAIQTHGGIGITQELAIGHYFKRATMIEGQFGSADYHLDRYERITLAD